LKSLNYSFFLFKKRENISLRRLWGEREALNK